MVLDYVAKEWAGMQFIMHPMLLFCSTALYDHTCQGDGVVDTHNIIISLQILLF